MKFDAKTLAAEPMKNITFALPESVIDRIDRLAAKQDVSCPNRSAWLRSVILSAITREHRAAEKTVTA
ncbi:hypothetical protein [Nitrobacter sp. TKz-YC02]|uniref:hypothetical protein n=1 Tax=Nitrobacter sp. TKz-YC02 TaxID=3398704 RepID=UPI003CEBDCF9